MEFLFHTDSPLGAITLASDGRALTGLWFDGQKYFAAGLSADAEERALPVFEATLRWLDVYFQGGLGAPAGDPLRQYRELWGSFRPHRGKPGPAPFLRPGGGRRRRPQPHLPHRPLSPGPWRGRQPHRLRRGRGQKGKASPAGGRPPVLIPEREIRTFLPGKRAAFREIELPS